MGPVWQRLRRELAVWGAGKARLTRGPGLSAGRGRRAHGAECAERAGCWAGAGEAAVREGVLGRWRGKPGWAERGEREECCGLGLKLGWAAMGFLFFWVFSSFLFQTSLKLIEFKLEFEFNPSTQTIKTMHQHECNNKFKPRNFLITL